MRYLPAVLGVVVGIWSLSVSMALLIHLIVLAVCAVPVWLTDVMIRPLAPCKYCDKGRSWDRSGEHFGEFCPGAVFGLGSCGGAGRKLRPAVKLLRIFGIGSKIPDPVRPDDL